MGTLLTEDGIQWLRTADLDLAVLPTGDFDDDVDDAGLAGVWVQWHVVPEGDGLAFVLEPDSPVLLSSDQWLLMRQMFDWPYQCVARSNLP